MNNAPVGNHKDHTIPDDESGEWAITLYEPYPLPPEAKEGGDTDEEWVLTIYEPYCLPVKPLGQEAP